jgi:hypothetical protein
LSLFYEWFFNMMFETFCGLCSCLFITAWFTMVYTLCSFRSDHWNFIFSCSWILNITYSYTIALPRFCFMIDHFSLYVVRYFHLFLLLLLLLYDSFCILCRES